MKQKIIRANGVPSNSAIEDALNAALNHQENHPPVIQPPKADAPTAPPEPPLYSPEWFAQLLAINEANYRQQQGNVAVLQRQLREAEDAAQRIAGALDTLRALQAMGAGLGKQQGEKE